MTKRDFERVKSFLKYYPDCITSKEDEAMWWDTLKEYPANIIMDVVKKYVDSENKPPTPKEIIIRVPHARPDQAYTPRYEDMDGKSQKTIQCQRCHDTGLIVWYDKENRRIGRPCDCPAGHKAYRWGWLDREQQQQFSDSYGGYGVNVGEDWRK